MNRLKIYRRFLIAALLLAVITLGIFGFYYMRDQVPDEIRISEEEEQTLDVGLKEVSVRVVKRERVIPGGIPVGIYLETSGVYVVGIDAVQTSDGFYAEPAGQAVQPGDYILAVNGRKISDKKELIACVQANQTGIMILKLRRNEEEIQVRVHAVESEDQDYKLGIWVKDDVQGIGTLTYLTQDYRFGALGHGITDTDTGELLEIADGSLYETKILNIVKGERGTPGELSGVITYANRFRKGSILKNTRVGIFGQADAGLAKELIGTPVEVAFRQEIKSGPAVIRSSVSGELKDYEIQIQEVRFNESNENKGMIFKVTDPELINLTGGVIQGMSGSPILQDGRLIGAVTHVFVNDPTKGYAGFAESMLEKSILQTGQDMLY